MVKFSPIWWGRCKFLNFDFQGKKLFLLSCFPWLLPNHERGLGFLGPCQQGQGPRESREERSRGPGCLDNLVLQDLPNVEVLAAQLCLTLYKPMDCSPPVSSVHGILQERILEWVAISFYPPINTEYENSKEEITEVILFLQMSEASMSQQ